MRSFIKASLAATLLFGCASTVYAQDNAPRTLAPRTLSPVGQAPTVVPSVTPVPVKTISGGINVQSLDQVNKEALGVLSGSKAFASTMWSGTNRPFVENLLETLPARPSAPYLRILQRRLLLSAAQPPQGVSAQKSLLSIRAAKLAEMGQTNDVISLIKSAPQNERNNDLAILETEALLLNNKISDACSLASSNFSANQDTFWVKTMAFCRMLAKQNDQAMLSLSLLQDSGDNDPVYYDLMNSLNAGERGHVKSLPAAKPLELALISASKAILSKEVRASDDPNMLSLLTKAGDIYAIQKAVEANLASVDFLRETFKRIKFSDKELADALSSAQSLEPLKAQALLYQVSAKPNQLAVIRTETISLALDLAKKNGTFFSIARLYRPMISNLARSIDLLWFAPKAMRALLAAGDWESAKAWFLMLRNAAFTDVQAAKSWTDVRPLAVFAGFDVAPQAVNQALAGWWKAQAETPQSFARANRLFSVADGLGLVVSDQLWLSLMQGPKLAMGQAPKAGIWLKMNKAAMAGRLGETVLLALHGLGHEKTANMDSNYLRDALFALRSVGLERDARAVAVETSLQAGF
ncbi:exported hypothetical protein [Candidatus Terasakiella magnetica]|uniref:Antifreeze glycopeptide polyprotein n=1 Tax=Candidatus Terasakiella magnetica TaxID=1867952 RepID=A0A1C3RKT0_9PROT|nr:hypothetical protein [Candidatus Terasakiella magnetica]SCA57930.1 exported hypothetical protein [Candidatus Terasakiella magnetica]